MTIERVLPTQETETEFFNRNRREMGLEPLPACYRVTKIRPGLQDGCGCSIGDAQAGHGFIVEHDAHCAHRAYGPRFVACDARGQAAASIIDDDGTELVGVMRLDQPFPYESHHCAICGEPSDDPLCSTCRAEQAEADAELMDLRRGVQ